MNMSSDGHSHSISTTLPELSANSTPSLLYKRRQKQNRQGGRVVADFAIFSRAYGPCGLKGQAGVNQRGNWALDSTRSCECAASEPEML